jgi:hypothetical protein
MTVEIVGVKASCGCTEVELSEKLLAPGASGTVTGKLSAEGRLGNFGSTLRFETLAGDFQETTVRGQAMAPLVGPTHLDLGETYLGEQAAVTTFTYSSGEDDLEWDTLKVKAEGMNASVKAKGDQWEVSLQPVVEKVVGKFKGGVTVECWKTGDDKPVAIVAASAFWGTRSRVIGMEPGSAYFGVVSPQQEGIVRLKVAPYADDQSILRLKSVHFPLGMKASAKIVSLRNEQFLEIRVQELAPMDKDEKQMIQATLAFDGNEDIIFRIPIIGINSREKKT